MALDPSSGFNALTNVGTGSLPIIDVEHVQLQFSIAADFVAAQVANNVLVMALSDGRILRIDLNKPEDIDDIDLPKKPEPGLIRRMFLDPTASHLIICTSKENYYLHSQSRQPRPLARLRGVSIESVAWNPSLPMASTREILLGTTNGLVYETSLEPSTDFYRKEDKFLKTLHKLPLDAHPVTGLWVDALPDLTNDTRRVLIATPSRLLHLVGKVGRSSDGSASIYTKLFEAEHPTVHELPPLSPAAGSALVVSPDPQDASGRSGTTPTSLYPTISPDRAFAWLSSHGVFHGRLLMSPAGPELGNKVFAESKLLPRVQLAVPQSLGRRPGISDYVDAIALTQWHVVSLIGGRVVAANRLTGGIVFDQPILEPGQKPLGLSVDLQKNTFWLFTSKEIFEILVRDEDRDIWKIMLDMQQFDAALQYAHTPAQKDAVDMASGDYLVSKGLFNDAAAVYGKSSKPFEEVALSFIENNQPDALRRYLMTKLATYKKSFVMQRIMIASWLVEIFMARLNSLDDTIATKAELSETLNTAQTQEQLDAVRRQYRDFVGKHKADLDRKTVYDIISSHGREQELLYFANAIDDYDYVLNYWIQRERWSEALGVLKRQTDAEVFYRCSGVLMTHAPGDLVEILIRQQDKLIPRKLIPALLEYDRSFKGSLAQNQAVRYLNYVVDHLQSTDAAVHNTLVSILASHPSNDESAVLAYLETQQQQQHQQQQLQQHSASGGPDDLQPLRCDPDFALRLCIQHRRVLSCVHIYTGMGQYAQAVDLALSHGEIELASIVADRPMSSPPLRKRLWLAVARKVIARSGAGFDGASSGNGVVAGKGGRHERQQQPNGAVKDSAGHGSGRKKTAPASSGIKAAIEFLGRCDLLRIEDLIPLFPDFVVIDDFKEEICGALEAYGRDIDALRREMDEAGATAQHIREDVAALDRRYAILEPGERCHACGLPLLSRQFFVFPCQHAFHSDCLGRRVLEQAGPARARRIRECQVQIAKGAGATPAARREALVAELDGLVASACILCSDLAIKRVDEPFVREGEDKGEWAL